VHAGDVIWNPLTGEKAMLVESAEESGGERIVSDFSVERGGFVPGGEHIHDHCDEHFEVRAGQITFVADGEERTLGPGEKLTVPAGTWHRWWNPGEDEVQLRTRVEPALDFERALMVFWGLCADGHVDETGTPSPLLGSLVATRFRREIRFREPPDAVQRVLFPALAFVARRRGLDKTIDRYLDPDSHPSAQTGRGRLPENVMRA
jgi:mannose-6-phosphate isomerase-like protein (cupin superfamily)